MTPSGCDQRPKAPLEGGRGWGERLGYRQASRAGHRPSFPSLKVFRLGLEQKSLGLGLGATLALAIGLAAAGPAAAQPGDPGVELTVDAFHASFDTTVRLDDPSFRALLPALDLESDLGLPESSTELRAGLVLRASRRQRITLDYVGLERSATQTLALSVPGFPVTLSGDFASRLNSRMATLGYSVSPIRTETTEIAVSIGAAYLDLEAEIAAVGNTPPPLRFDARGDVRGAVPAVGAHGAWRFGDRFRLALDGRYFRIHDLDGWSGSLRDLAARFDWFVLPHLALGAGWSGTTLEADTPAGEAIGRIEYDFSGPRAGITLAF